MFLIKYKDYLTVIISTRWLRIKGAASKACLGEAKARFASFLINHQESLFSRNSLCTRLPSDAARAPVGNSDPYRKKISRRVLKQAEQENSDE